MITHWKAKDGKVIAISEMTEEHLINCLKMVESRQDTYRRAIQYLQEGEGDGHALDNRIAVEIQEIEELIAQANEYEQAFFSEILKKNMTYVKSLQSEPLDRLNTHHLLDTQFL